MTTCSKCKRPKYTGDFDFVGQCSMNRLDSHHCDIAAAAYRRGVLRGVEIAREHVIVRDELDDLAELDWSDVDRAVRGEVGE